MYPTRFSAHPADTGLYRRAHEHDACGVAMVATMRGTAGHDIVEHALTALRIGKVLRHHLTPQP